ncbi:unnamed protein product [Rotaria sordida]|uniref:1,4-alpha-glucan branching enzyme n=1 Tax=Rotaria sordida TaxID=392033 RepID=A0A818X8F8_9BILA|nr:unnamed protein product [Rotaria sordida]CAF3736653.1 unnamed protein product [Rotaria sordida]
MAPPLASQIEFTLFAPNINSVSLIGSFSAWQGIPMRKFNDGQWRLNVSLEDGEYEYAFRLQPIVIEKRKNGKKEPVQLNKFQDVIDPYAMKVNLSKNVGVVTIKNGMKIIDEYEWKYDNEAVNFPQNKDLVIYELYIGDFTEKEHSWGYAIRHFFCIRSAYGTSEDLKHFVDECHHRRIRVIFDAICNHAQGECPLYQIDPTPYFYWNQIHHPEHPEEHWGPEFNYEKIEAEEDKWTRDVKPAVQFMSDLLRYYIEEFHIDGLRLRHHSAAIRSDNLNVFHADMERQVLAYERWSSENEDDRVVVIANFSKNEYKGYKVINWHMVGRWEQVFGTSYIQVATTHLILNLSAHEGIVFMYKSK